MLAPLAAVAVLLVLWELVVQGGIVAETNIPPASAALSELVNQLAEGAFWSAVGSTLQGWVIGLGIAIALGVPLGLLIGLEPLGLPGAARADRVPAPDPVGRADPARGADLRPGAAEQGLPGRRSRRSGRC